MYGTIDAAKELGAPVVNHYCYFLNMSTEHNFEVLEKYWRKPLEYAKQLGIKLVLENEAHDGTRTPELMRKILDYFNDDHFLTNYDAMNYFQASSEGYPAGYDILKDKIGYVHIKNGCIHRNISSHIAANTGKPMSGVYEPALVQYVHMPYGAVNIAGLLTNMKEDNQYHGVFTLEPHTKDESLVEGFLAREISWLRELNFIRE
jgi:sugar phosphate isomerase/epimerase